VGGEGGESGLEVQWFEWGRFYKVILVDKLTIIIMFSGMSCNDCVSLLNRNTSQTLKKIVAYF